MKTFKTSLLLVSVFILVTAFAPPKKGQTYQSDEAKFSIIFPGAYESDVVTGENNITHKITCTVDNQTYFASYTVHQFVIDDQEGLAGVSYDSFLASIGGKEVSKSEWVLKKNKGLKAKIDLTESLSTLEYRVVLVGSIQYQLVVLAATGDYDDKAAQAFFDSFKLMK